MTNPELTQALEIANAYIDLPDLHGAQDLALARALLSVQSENERIKAETIQFMEYTKRCYSSHQMYDKWDINRLEHMLAALASQGEE